MEEKYYGIFGVQTNLKPKSFIHRDDIAEIFDRALREYKHVLIYGGTKQGKSSIVTDKLTSIDHIVVRPDSKEGCREIAQRIYSNLQSKYNKHFVGFDPNIFNLEDVRQRFPVFGLKEEDKIIVVLENYHKIMNSPESKLFLEQIRNSAEGNHPILFVLIGILQDEDITFVSNNELIDRMETISLENWKLEHMEKIINKGLGVVGIGIEEKTKNKIITTSNGHVGVLQELMRAVLEEYLKDKNKILSKNDIKFNSDVHESEIYGSMIAGKVGIYGRGAINQILEIRSSLRPSNKNIGEWIVRYLLEEWDKSKLSFELDGFIIFIENETSTKIIDQKETIIAELEYILKLLKEKSSTVPISFSSARELYKITDRYFLFYLKNTLDEIKDGILVHNDG